MTVRAGDGYDMNTLTEQAREIPIVADTDVCVLGGSCTGVFAAVRAARLGARVVLVEREGRFGGCATNSLVNVWHSLYDTEGKRQIIAGLTLETIRRLQEREAVQQDEESPCQAYVFNSEEMAIELDEIVLESKIEPHLHTMFCAPIVDGDRLVAVAVEGKSGRKAIRAKVFIDATGDGDLCERLDMDTYVSDPIQPPTTCARFLGWRPEDDLEPKDLIRQHGAEYAVPEGFMWGSQVPQSDVHMLAGTRIRDKNCGIAEDLTHAEMEGRRQVRAMMDIIRKYRPKSIPTLQALPSAIGIRESRHVRCRHRLGDDEVLRGTRFDDAIANGSYRVDVHHQDKPGITLKYLDGTQVYTAKDGDTVEPGRWRPETTDNPTFYQIPLRSIIPAQSQNIIVAGRMLDASHEAFAAARVMVNMNQTGEAAGVTAYQAATNDQPVGDIDATDVRSLLAEGGSLVI